MNTGDEQGFRGSGSVHTHKLNRCHYYSIGVMTFTMLHSMFSCEEYDT